MTARICPRTLTGHHYMILLRTVRRAGYVYKFSECACCGMPEMQVTASGVGAGLLTDTRV
jgi:hypothetical protein